MPALQYHSRLVQSAWLSTNPVNLEGSAHTPQERLSSQKLCLKPNVISWLRKITEKARHLTVEADGEHAPVRHSIVWPSLMWTIVLSVRGWAGPGPHENLLTISSNMREMHTERDTPWNTNTHSQCFPSQEHCHTQLESKPSLLWHVCCISSGKAGRNGPFDTAYSLELRSEISIRKYFTDDCLCRTCKNNKHQMRFFQCYKVPKLLQIVI